MPIEATLLATACLLAAAPAAPAAPAQDDLSAYAPEGTILWFQTTDHAPVLEQGLDHPLVAKILAHPLVQADLEKKGQDPVAALAGLEAILGEPPLDLAADLTSGGVGVGVLGWNRLFPRVFFVMRGSDADDAEGALETLIGAAQTFGGAKELGGRQRGKLGERVAQAWTVGEDGAVLALMDDGLMFVATSLEDLRECTRRRGGAEELQAARRALGADSGTFAWVDLDSREGRGQLGELREAASQPGMHFVRGPVRPSAGPAGSLGSSLTIDGDGIELRSRAVGAVAGAGAATFPAEGSTAPPLPRSSEREVARAVIHRDVPTLLAERTELFPPRAQPGIAEGLSNFALLVGGADAVDELFGSIEPNMLLLAEDVTFGEGVEPDVVLPAACIVARVRDAAVNGPRVVGAFQSLIALTNVQRAQNGEPGLVLGLDSVAGTTLSLAKLPAPAADDGVDLAYNLAPGCALVGDTVVLGTHHALVASVVERLVEGRTESPSDGRVDHLRVRAGAIADLIARNRDLLVMQTVLNDGKTQGQAEAEIELLRELVAAIDSVEFSTSGTAAEGGTLETRIRVGLAR